MRNFTLIFLGILISTSFYLMDTRIRQLENRKTTIDLKHQQELWLSVLEWCESRGILQAINPLDRDGIPSFGAFQFKPETFKKYLARYELPKADLMDYETQKEIVRRMINDSQVVWTQEFPDCIKKIGKPPS